MTGEAFTYDWRDRTDATVRPAARAIVLDAEDRVLLVRGTWDGGAFWFTPGGAIEPGEAPEETERREVAEETGLDPDGLEWGPCVWVRRWVWHWVERDRWIDSRERFYLARLPVPGPPVHLDERFAEDILDLSEARWWSVEDLAASGERTSPLALAELLPGVIRGDYPDPPLEIAQ